MYICNILCVTKNPPNIFTAAKIIAKNPNILEVSKIFSDLGELEFRKIEKIMLNQVLSYDHKFILSLGGGTPCYYDNMDMILSRSNNVFYIKVLTNILSNRLFLRKEKRPIISNIQSIEKMNEFVSKHIFERMPFYEKSNYIIESNRND